MDTSIAYKNSTLARQKLERNRW